jgi:DNA-binding transcriptional LysR family regulator
MATTLRDLEIDLLRSFLAVAEAGSMTAGAAIVGRTQSAVSQKILRLEETVGRKLFDRSSRSLTITADGERLRAAARHMIELNDDTMRQFLEPQVAGRLRLGVTEDFIPLQLPRLLARFVRTCPTLELELTTGLCCDLLAALEDGRLDLAIAKRDGTMQRGRIIWREPLVWIGSHEIALDAQAPVPLVALPPPCSYRGLMLETLASAGRACAIACTASSLMGVQAAVAGGLGVTILGRSFVQPGLKILDARAGFPSLPTSEIVLIGDDQAAHLARPLLSFLTESLSALPEVA